MTSSTIKIEKPYCYLSQVISELPSHCLINKGITGCGGTTVELLAPRNSILLCPTKNLVLSKKSEDYLGVTGDVKNNQIINYINSRRKYKKIIATYDSLPRLMEIIPDYENYFLLIDEYHLLFNDYSFRGEAIMFVLNNFRKFNDWAFLTATPLKKEFILEELKDVDQIVYEWESAVPVNITLKNTRFVIKELLKVIEDNQDKNIHIFLNSISTINKIAEKLEDDNYRVLCSENSKRRTRNTAKVTDPVKKINFYTSCSFEGCDIYDPDGLCVIISDTNISTTVLDISTKVRQICGRLRDSKYKDEVILILNTTTHRYAGKNKDEFLEAVAESERLGKIKANTITSFNEDQMMAELRTYTPEGYSNIYLNRYKNTIFYDVNLKYLDIYNYDLINEIYHSAISVLTECAKNKIKPKSAEIIDGFTGFTWIKEKLIKNEYTYEELKEIFEPLFPLHGLKWNKKTSINTFFPPYEKKRRTVNGKKYTVYVFSFRM